MTDIASTPVMWAAIIAPVHDGLPRPKVRFTESARDGGTPLVTLSFGAIADAVGWAAHIGLSNPSSITLGQVVHVGYSGGWLGWRVLVVADEPVAADLAVAP